MTLWIIGAYLVGVLAIGVLSHRLFRGTGEDYFVATRTIGPFVLLMSLFGTNMTAFSILGASGEAYRRGIGVFALMASSSAILVPAVFFFVGIRMWAAGKRHGFLTQAQFFRARWGNDALGLALFGVLVTLVVPYLLIGVKGGGLTLTNITGGQVPPWVGGLLISVVVVTYVTYGGLRGTAWANTFQTLVFMTLGAVTAIYLVRQLGGLGAALDAVEASHPRLLIRGDAITPLELLSYTLIPVAVGMFPHIFQHWLSASRVESFRLSMIAYPFCVAIVWLPSVLLGVLGRIDFPGLEGPAAGGVLIRMIDFHAPDLLAGLLGAGVFAAVMSSLDSQVLAVGTMFTQDVVRHYGFHDRMSERAQILSGRLFVITVVAITYGLSLIVDTSIFGLAVWSFSGFTALLPLAVAALYWKRSNATGGLAAVLTVAVLWGWLFLDGHDQPGYKVAGLMPVVILVAASTLALVAGSLLGKPTAPDRVARFFPRETA